MSRGARVEAVPNDTVEHVPVTRHLPTTIRSLLMSTCDAASLCTLEVRVCGQPDMGATVRRRSEVLAEVGVWLTHRPPTRWHDGFVVAASAADADAKRRAIVEHTATLVGELLAAEGRTSQAEALARRALEIAGADPLTQLGNRRTWRRALDEETRRAVRYGTATTVVVVDLDGLKRINDEHGHAAGDAYLQRVATAIRTAARSVDVVCRLGGDEFGLLAPQTDRAGATRLAPRLRAALEAADIRASIGIATATEGKLDQAWQDADAAMYDDKRSRTRASGSLTAN